MISGLSQEQLGDWTEAPLGIEHQAVLLKVLKDICITLYKSMGTSLQEDRALLLDLEVAQKGAAESAGNASCHYASSPGGPFMNDSDTAVDLVHAVLATTKVQPADQEGSGDVLMLLKDVLLAVQYRIAAKRCLEQELNAILDKAKGH
jgi:hypothetical protein